MPRAPSVVEVLWQLSLRKSGPEEAAKWFEELTKVLGDASASGPSYLATSTEVTEALRML